MSSEHVTEQVPLAEIREGDTIQDPKSGQWFTVTRTAEGTSGVEAYRLYYGDERDGEHADSECFLDSRFTEGVVNRQVRE